MSLHLQRQKLKYNPKAEVSASALRCMGIFYVDDVLAIWSGTHNRAYIVMVYASLWIRTFDSGLREYPGYSYIRTNVKQFNSINYEQKREKAA